jgi:quercetin dioxygenase-like cupin family protein
MEEKYNKATMNRPEGTRVLDAPLVKMDIYEYIQQLKNEAAWQKNDRNGITLYKTDGMRIVLVIMHTGAEMRPQTVDGIISFHVLEGGLQIETQDETTNVESGQILTLHSNIKHYIRAAEQTTFILTMTNENYGQSAYKYFPI